MEQYGDFEILDEILRTTNYVVFEAESPSRFGVFTLRVSLSKSFNDKLESAHNIQKELARLKPKQWLLPIESGLSQEGFFYSATTRPNVTLASIMEASIRLSSHDILFILKSVANALLLLDKNKRGHGNLVPDTVYLIPKNSKKSGGIREYSILLSEINPDFSGNFYTDIGNLVKIAYVMATSNYRFATAPNLPVDKILLRDRRFNNKRFLAFFNKYVAINNADSVKLNEFIKEVGQLRAKRNIIIPTFFLLGIIGVSLAAYFQIASTDKYEEPIPDIANLTSGECLSIWTDYCRRYELWFESFTEYYHQERDDSSFPKYYKLKIVQILTVDKTNLSDYDPRSAKLANLDIDIYSDIKECGKILPDDIANNSQKKLFLLKASNRMKKVEEIILKWDGFLKYETLRSFFISKNISLPWLSKIDNSIFDKNLHKTLSNIEEISKLSETLVSRYNSIDTIIGKLNAFDDEYIRSFDKSVLNKSLSQAENIEQFTGLLELNLLNFSKLLTFCNEKYSDKFIDIKSFKAETSATLKNSFGDWKSIDKWKGELYLYARMPSEEFVGKVQVWNSKIEALDNKLSGFGYGKMSGIATLQSQYVQLKRQIESYSHILNIEKNRKELSGQKENIDSSLSTLESLCGKFILSQKANLEESVVAWLSENESRKWETPYIDTLWRSGMSKIIGAETKASLISSPEKFISLRDSCDKFCKALTEISKFDFIKSSADVRNLKDETIRKELLRFEQLEIENAREKIISSANALSPKDMCVSAIEAMPSTESSRKDCIKILKQISDLSAEIATIAAFENSDEFDTTNYKNTISAIVANPLIAPNKLKIELFSSYKNELDSLEQISAITSISELLAELNKQSLSTALKLHIWNKIFNASEKSVVESNFAEMERNFEKFSVALSLQRKKQLSDNMRSFLIRKISLEKSPEKLLVLKAYSEKLKVAESEMDSNSAAKLFIVSEIDKLTKNKKSTAEECRSTLDKIAETLALRFKGNIYTNLINGKLVELKNSISAKSASDKPVGPALHGWSESGKSDNSIQFINGNLKLDFAIVDLKNGDSYYLLRNEISAALFIEWIERKNLWNAFSAQMPSVVKDYDIFDSRTGPRVWIAQNNGKMRLRKSSESWIEKPPTWMDFQLSPTNLNTGNIPIEKLPIQYLSPELAEAFAKSLGCELPTVSVWKAALEKEGNENMSWNLRDSDFEKQNEYTEKLISQNGLERIACAGDSYDSIIFPKASAKSIVSSDEIVWFDSVDTRGKIFYNIIGNVAEYLKDENKYAISGASALSNTARPFGDILPLDNIDTSNGFSDVGFRIMFKKLRVMPNQQLRTILINLLELE